MKLIFDAFRDRALDTEGMADRLEFIASQIRQGYICGDAGGVGWWSLNEASEE